MKAFIVFVISVAAGLLFLGIERFAGIPWDFHPDSVTYATLADDTVRAILAESPLRILNNGYYFWASLLGMSIGLMTAANILMFAATNSVLFAFHDRYCDNGRNTPRWLLALFLLLANPYRLHLATTALKDTMILMCVVLMATSRRRFLPWTLVPLVALRVAALFYAVIKLERKQLIQILVLGLLVAFAFASALGDRLLEFNSADMQLREFDRIPNFRDLGLIGTLARAVSWPLLAWTGAFAALSPALAFFPVAIGSITNQLYCRMVLGRFAFPLAVLVPMMIIAAIVTGYTAYIRYIYPLMVVLPIVAVQQFSSQVEARQSKRRRAPAFS